MSENNNPGNNNTDVPNDSPGDGEVDIAKLLSDEKVRAALEKIADDKLKAIKDKLDSAYAERDTAKKTLEAQQKAAAEAEATRLEQEGKVAEALKVRIAQLEKESKETADREAAAEARIVVLTRDLAINAQLKLGDFKNAKAQAAAEREIQSLLTKNDKNQWVGTKGEPLSDVVKAYLADPENSYLLAAKANGGSGTGTMKSNSSGGDGKRKKLSEMTQEEVIALAQEGKL